MSEGVAEGGAWTGYGADQVALEQWVRSRLGDKSMDDLGERAIRVVEEAIELYQAEIAGRSGDATRARAMCHRLVDAVFDKPVGLPEQEGGGVITTLLAWAAARGVRLDVLSDREIKRIFRISPEHFQKRTAEKVALGIIGSDESTDGDR